MIRLTYGVNGIFTRWWKMWNGMNRATCDMIIGARTVSRKMDLRRPILVNKRPKSARYHVVICTFHHFPTVNSHYAKQQSRNRIVCEIWTLHGTQLRDTAIHCLPSPLSAPSNCFFAQFVFLSVGHVWSNDSLANQVHLFCCLTRYLLDYSLISRDLYGRVHSEPKDQYFPVRTRRLLSARPFQDADDMSLHSSRGIIEFLTAWKCDKRQVKVMRHWKCPELLVIRESASAL
jgi:hypothetical protein